MSYAITVTKDNETITCITIEQAAARSGYNEQYMRRLMRDGKLRGIKVSRIWLVEVKSLEAYLKEVHITRSEDARFGPRRSTQPAC